MYAVTEANVKLCNDMQSEWFNTLCGLWPCGSLSPTLFSFYLNGLATEIKELNAGIDVNGRTVDILVYVISPEINKQNAINKQARYPL